jgi:hypothetical protein
VTSDTGLDELRATAKTVVDRLLHLRYAPGGDASHSWHMDWLERAGLLAGHLESVLRLEQDGRYPSAFAMSRVALEQYLLDRLIVLADRWEQHIVVPPDRDPDEVRAHLDEQLKDGSLVSYRKAGARRFIAVRRGLTFENDPSEWLSAYTFWDERYDPFQRAGVDQARLQSTFMAADEQRRYAQESVELWHRAFNWPSIRRNLKLNALLSNDELFHLDVHYGFLSAYVHPTSAGFDAALERNKPRLGLRFNHYAAELLTLYVTRIAIREIETIASGLSRKPACAVGEWESVSELIAHADNLSDYLWFLGGGPTAFDKVWTANQLEFKDRVRRDPSKLAEADLTYPDNPLSRIARLHWTFQELVTGHLYVSPWPRADAAQAS